MGCAITDVAGHGALFRVGVEDHQFDVDIRSEAEHRVANLFQQESWRSECVQKAGLPRLTELRWMLLRAQVADTRREQISGDKKTQAEPTWNSCERFA